MLTNMGNLIRYRFPHLFGETNMAASKKIESRNDIDVHPVRTGKMDVFVVGMSPFICNRLSEKAARELLMPRPGRLSAADKKTNLKHDPMSEFRASPYTILDETAPTFLAVPAGAFKGAICNAALDTGGISKAQIGRLTWIVGYDLPLFGIPQILLSIVRNSDQNHTPDVRSRAIVPQWATAFSINYVEPNLRNQHVADLLTNAGLICGVGDWRQQKGSGSFGQFRLVAPNDPDFLHLRKTAGRAEQIEAMANPEPHNAETKELLTWFGTELHRRGFTPNFDHTTTAPAAEAAPPPTARRGRKAGDGKVLGRYES